MLHSNFLYKACRNYSGGLSEPDLLAHLQKQANKQGYIKALLRADMEQRK